MKLIIQIPSFNEETSLGATLAELPRDVPGFDHVETLVIDDGSSDATGDVARRVSGTRVPDAASGFRAFSRRAALRLNVFSDFTYTLETIIQAGKKHIPIAHVPVETNPERRPSRLFGRVTLYVRRSIATLVR